MSVSTVTVSPGPAIPAAGPARPAPGAVATPTRRHRLLLMGLVALAYLFPVPYHLPINNPNENVRFYMTAALVEDGTYCIDGPRKKWGWVNDAARFEGRHYSVKGPATSLLGLPGYALAYGYAQLRGEATDRHLALWLCRLTGSILPTLAFLWFLLPWLGRRTASPLLRDAAWLTVALGANTYGYALLFVSHTLAGVCGFGALMLLSRRAGDGRVAVRDAFFAGLLAAGVTASEYPGIVVTLVLCGLALVQLRPWRLLVPFALGALIPTLAVMHMQWRSFGNPLSPGHLHMENAAFRAYHERGVFGADAFHGDAAFELLFNEGYGLFPLTPLLLFGLPGFALLLMRPVGRKVGVAATLAALGLWLECAFLSNWRGGWTIGPRYLTPLIPFAAWAALVGVDALWRFKPRLAEAAALGATLVGFVASGVPSAWYPHLPEGLTRPLPQLFGPLLAGGYAPYNAANLLDLWGGWSMAPWYLALAGVWVAAGAQGTWPGLPMPLGRKLRMAGPLWSRRFAGGAAVAAVLLVPLLGDPKASEPKHAATVARDRSFVTRHWRPAGHDRVARLQARASRTAEEQAELALLLKAQGRERELRKGRRRP